MTMRIKIWKVGQIMTDMSKYGDRYDIDIEGQGCGVLTIKIAKTQKDM